MKEKEDIEGKGEILKRERRRESRVRYQPQN